MNPKIKILKDTPFNLSGEELSISEFRQKYGYICSSSITDEELISYMKDYKSYPQLAQSTKYCISDWFEVIEIPKNDFKLEDWVWHEELKKAFCIKPFYIGIDFHPNYITLEAANRYVDTYKRKATSQEIKNNELYLTCNGRALVGRYESYYFNNVWEPIFGVVGLISAYLCADKEYFANMEISKKDSDIFWECRLDGIKVGCTMISHDEIIKLVKFLKLKT